MHKSDPMQLGWLFAAKAAGAVGAVQAGDAYLGSIEDAIRQMEDSINNHPYRTQPADKFQGYVQEEYHAGTFNADAAAARSGDHAETLQSHDIGSVDIKLKSGREYSAKSYATPEQSAAEQARMDPETRRPLYKNQERLVPTDQLDEAKAAAARRAVRNQNSRPDVSESYSEAGERLTDRIENDEGVSSRPATRKELDRIASEAKDQKFKAEDHDITPESFIKTEYLLKEAGKAGITTAAITMAVQLAPAIIESVDYLIRTGEIRIDRLKSQGILAVSAGGESFLRGAAAFILTLAVKEGKLGKALKGLNPTVIGILTVMTIEIVKGSILVAAGKMQPRELGATLVRTTVIAAGTAAVTSAIIKACGATGQALLTQFPVVGYIIGTLVGCAVSALYGVGKRWMISICMDTGFTCFGLVEQDYALPEEALHELGIDTIQIPRVDVPITEVEIMSWTIEPEKVQPDKIGFTMLRRGVIGVNRIGFVPDT